MADFFVQVSVRLGDAVWTVELEETGRFPDCLVTLLREAGFSGWSQGLDLR